MLCDCKRILQYCKLCTFTPDITGVKLWPVGKVWRTVKFYLAYGEQLLELACCYYTAQLIKKCTI